MRPTLARTECVVQGVIIRKNLRHCFFFRYGKKLCSSTKTGYLSPSHLCEFVFDGVRVGEKKKLKVKSEGKKEVKKESEEASKIPKISLMDPSSVRANAKRALYQILWKR